MKRCFKLAQLLALIMFLAVFFRAVATDRNRDELVQREIEIDDRLRRLESRSVEIASQTNENSNRLDKIEAQAVPVSLAEIKTTITFDHTLMWFIAVTCAAMLIERVGFLVLSVKRGTGRFQVEREEV